MMIPTALANALRRNPFPVYAVMRRVAPVIQLRPGVWAVFDYATVKRVLVDQESFSSRAAPPGGAPLDWLIFQDPPRHTALRALITRTFAPRAVASLETRIRAIADRLLDDALPRGEMDLVTEFAVRLPLLVISEMLGLPVEDTARMTGWGAAIIGLGDTIYGGERAARAGREYRAAREEMHPYLLGLLAARRAARRDDLITRLAESEVDGERLTDDDIFSFFQLLLLAGTETTTNLIANTILCFFEHPEQYARVRAAPELVPAMLEEVLRYRTPVQMVFRAAARDVPVHDRVIPEGGLVLAMVGSANRDPRQFPKADQFDIGRTGQPHVGFGHGAHFCIGAALARLEGRIAITTLLERTTDLHRATRRPWVPRTGINVHGPSSLPLRLSAVAS